MHNSDPETKKKKRFWNRDKDEENGEKKQKPRSATLFELFSFATPLDLFLMIIGIFSAIVVGTSLPLAMYLIGQVTNAFINQQATDFTINYITSDITYNAFNDTATETLYFSTSPGIFNCSVIEPIVQEYFTTSYDTICEANVSMANSTINFDIDNVNCTLLDEVFVSFFGEAATCSSTNSFINDINMIVIFYVIIACVTMLFGFTMIATFQVTSERQVHRMRLAYYKAVLRQDIAWFDLNQPGEISSRMSDDLDKVLSGTGEKLVTFFQYMTTFFAGFTIGFVQDWRLTLMLLGVTPFLAVSGAIFTWVLTRYTTRGQQSYANASVVAEEVLSSVKTVIAFGGEYKESERYDRHLMDARKLGAKKGLAVGLSLGFLFFLLFTTYAIGFWFGGWLISQDLAQGGDVLIVFFSIIVGAFSLGQAIPSFEYFATALGAAGKIVDTTKRVPPIDSNSDDGIVLNKDEENNSITFRNVNFTYPARPDVEVLKSFDLSVNVGQTVALVGHSGCGKSTVIQLLQRFYDVDSGDILIGAHPIKELNVKYLRSIMGVVSQEPVLFDMTIMDNIKFGREDATNEEIEQAAKDANVHDFIEGLPQRYNTLVGERGAQLSGGQKQRVAIARALLSNPKILLLDEATSALDSESEKLVQTALEKASEGRTTIIIAHRLSTIQNADLIVCIDEGNIVETGSHGELMKLEGFYHEMVTAQIKGVDEAFLNVGSLEVPKDDEVEEKPAVLRLYSKEVSRQFSHQFSRQKSDKKDEEKKSLKQINKEKQEEWDKELKPVPISRIMALNAKEWWIILLGILGALINGSVFPLFAIIFGEILTAFGETSDRILDATHLPAGLFLCLGVVSGIAVLIKNVCFSVSGEYLTARIRSVLFKAILRQEIGWFDEEKNSTGALTTRLSEDAAQVQGATGTRLATIVETVFTLSLALVIAFVYSWILTLVILGFAPFMIIAGALKTALLTKRLTGNKKSLTEAGKLAVDSIENIRTVNSLNLQESFFILYKNEVQSPHRSGILFGILEGVAYGISQGYIYFGYVIAFRFGAFLVTLDEDHILHVEFQDVFRVLFALLFGALAVGQASAFAPNYTKAKLSTYRIFSLLDRKPIIDNYSTDGKELDDLTGMISLDSVSFNYPTRPDVNVLLDLSISVKPGQTIALVGPSGCGKSTVVSLIERFYDPLNGGVLLDDVDLRELNIRWLRTQLGIVSQEPILFDTSISDNIRYGANHREVSDEEIIDSAKAANIHDFIQSLPQGYSTNAGDKGTQLSGGQKQRIAIARALIRNPKLLLLDEATSALDSESEIIVQEALDKAREGRTSIVIAHRLSTVYSADCIVVIANGSVVEKGTHTELLAKGGVYYQLHQHQHLIGDEEK